MMVQVYYDYQLRTWQSFGDTVLDLKLLSPAILYALLQIMSKADKLPKETEPVTCDNNTSRMLKPCHQTSVTPYSTDNCSITSWEANKIKEQWKKRSE